MLTISTVVTTGAVVLGVIGAGIGLAILGAIWMTWWLLPLWQMIAVGWFGLPSLTFWEFVAFKAFSSVIFHQFPPANQLEETKYDWAIGLSPLIAPPLIYWWVMWCVS